MIAVANPKTGLQISSLESAEGGVRRKDIPAYGPGVPEYQETIQTRPRLAAGESHPWKVTSAGPATVAVSAGCVLGVRTPGTTRPWYVTYVQYSGGDVSIGASGWIYAVVDVDTVLLGSGLIISGTDVLTRSLTPTSATAVFSASNPDSVADGTGDQVWIPVAQVAIVDGAAVAQIQVLTHNPLIPIEEVVSS